jgi:hypothetical protein
MENEEVTLRKAENFRSLVIIDGQKITRYLD